MLKKIGPYLLLHLVLIISTIGGIFSKLASKQPFFSFEFCLFYGLLLLSLGVYAILWQQVLKLLPLNLAYANKGVTIIWGMLWGVLFFSESVSLSNIIGAAVVLGGVILMTWDGEKKHE
ncbi:MAG: transporter [Oscillospiraceae bacterium]|nr:transporter [Oscillospiraceae bacterium]